eukprot:COSAG02_NODE_680_length_18551_cov_16.648060_1_plen_162_part_10
MPWRRQAWMIAVDSSTGTATVEDIPPPRQRSLALSTRGNRLNTIAAPPHGGHARGPSVRAGPRARDDRACRPRGGATLRTSQTGARNEVACTRFDTRSILNLPMKLKVQKTDRRPRAPPPAARAAGRPSAQAGAGVSTCSTESRVRHHRPRCPFLFTVPKA